MSASEVDLNALLRKYRALNDLRHATGDKDPELLRALSAEFPGALRELDVLSDGALEARLRDVLAATRGDAIETWIDWMSAYHQLMRLVLNVRRHLLNARAKGDDTSPLAIAASVERELGQRCDADLVPGVSNPPAGRLNRLVLDALAKRFERSSDELETVLFPLLEGQARAPTPHA